ncbi:MAG TPA: hypothetical protein PLL77_16150 [Pyrinomonadaceae bacterium]|nr:hypothetical protein [Pyrinomonadaceae bacterium]
MRVSEYFKLGRTQPTLDFVDVDIVDDTPLFIDPRALSDFSSEWTDECVLVVQDFFQEVLEAIRKGQHSRARKLLSTLREPNETHLGLSKGQSKGRGLGRESAFNVWESLTTSEAAKSGLLEDLEDTILMVPGISSDIISDITTNLIRRQLIEYTLEQARYHDIPLSPGVDSGILWNPLTHRWYSEYARLPMTPAGKLLLIPKIIVRKQLTYDVDEYFNYYILERLQEVELAANSDLVELLRNGKRRVTKKDSKEKYGTGKSTVVAITKLYPALLEDYRKDKAGSVPPPLSHTDIAYSDGTEPPDWDALLSAVTTIPTGKTHASDYEKAVESLLTALFYPSLTNPKVQHEIHRGRKRIDITYVNYAQSGFFYWVGQHYPASHVFIECKNYTNDIANPELDQLSGRFSPKRGQIGLLVCRKFDNKKLFIERCIDTANDSRGYIVVLDDADLLDLIEARKQEWKSPKFELLQIRFEELIM